MVLTDNVCEQLCSTQISVWPYRLTALYKVITHQEVPHKVQQDVKASFE